MIEEEFQKEVNPEYIPKVIKTPLVPIIIFLIIMFVVSLLFLVFKSKGPNPSLPSTTEIPEAIYTPKPAVIKISSPLATDAAVLKIKKEIEDNLNTANSIDLSESNLSFPIIDFNIGF